MINYAKHRAAIELLYDDRATISRYVQADDPITKKTKQTFQVVHTDVPCRLSQTGLARNGQTEAQNNIASESKLFLAPEIEIKQGDELIVARGRMTESGWEPIAAPCRYQAGEPFPPYQTHQEVSLQRKDKA